MTDDRRPRVLTVDDDPGARKLLRLLLTPLAVRVEEAASGEEALRLLDGQAWDAVLLDLGLPGIQGLEVLAWIRARHTPSALPVVLVTGQDDQESRLRGLELGANDFVTKPVEAAELRARAGTMLAMRLAYRELGEKVRELEELSEVKKLFADYLVPDMRNPLAGARGFAELALERMRAVDGTAAGHLDRVLEAIDRVAAMATDVLDVSQMERHALVLRPGAVDAGAALASRARGSESLAALRGVTLATQAAPGLPRIAADPRLLDRVVENLVIHVLAHAPSPGTVRLSAHPAPGGVRLDVARDGEPIPPEIQGALFDLGAQGRLRARGYYDVNGLGLVFSRLAAEAMGGTLSLASGPGGPTVFSVTLPAA